MGKSNQTFSGRFYLNKNWRNESESGHVYQRITLNMNMLAILINLVKSFLNYIIFSMIAVLSRLRKLYNFGLKSSNYLIINCHGLKAVAMHVADIPGFSQIIIINANQGLTFE